MTSTSPRHTATPYVLQTTARKTTVPLVLALVSWTLGATANAHDSPHAHWCHADDVTLGSPTAVVIGHFDYSGAQMRVFAGQLADQPGSCGHVDHPDDWSCARQIAEDDCRSLSEAQSIDKVAQPLLAGPSTALSDDHHQSYQLAAGLYGACVICELHPAVP